MTISKEALQYIGDLALAGAGKSLATNTPVALAPDSSTLIDLEKYQAGRSRFRGTYTTRSLADFGAYVVERAAPDARGFIEQDAMRCVVLFNIGTPATPGHADDRAVLALKATAAYRALQMVTDTNLSQEQLSNWIEDWSQHLAAVSDEGENMSLAKAIAAVRTITVKARSESDHSASETSASRSAFDAIEASSKETLPAWLLVQLTPYEGLSTHEIKLRVSVITGGSAPVLKLRWVGEETQREAIAQEFKDYLAKSIQASAKLALGTFDAK